METSGQSAHERKLGTFNRLGQVAFNIGGAIARTAASAGELLQDSELRKYNLLNQVSGLRLKAVARRRASNLVVTSAGKGFKNIQQGVASGAGQLGQRIQQGPRQMQNVLVQLQKRLEEQRLLALLKAERDELVDVQIGAQLYEGAPQELRSRLWMALLDNPALARSVRHSSISRAGSADVQDLLPGPRITRRSSVEGSVSSPTIAEEKEQRQIQQPAAPSEETAASAADGMEQQQGQSLPPVRISADALKREDAVPNGVAEAAAAASGKAQPVSEVARSPVEAVAGGGNAAPATGSDESQQRGSNNLADGEELTGGALAADMAGMRVSAELDGSQGHLLSPDAGASTAALLTRRNSNGHLFADSPISQERGNGELPKSDSNLSRRSYQSGSSFGSRARQEGSGSAQPSPSPSPLAPPQPQAMCSTPRSRAREGASQEDIDRWEMVQDSSPLLEFEADNSFTARLHPAPHADMSPEDEALWQKLMVAIMTVPWPISVEYPEDCRYNTLLQISIGQEETDEVIARDIHRTFPEHPQFGFEQGQQALFRVLKAYSLHDLEVGYCQGMAFVAGVVLMYLPEEPAFRMLVRLMDEAGPCMRRLYLPGLEGLKDLLRKFEWLMERLFPAMADHLMAFGVAPVLYASQWFLTLFSCPFPASFACRVIDMMLVENSADILLQAALAIMGECQRAVLLRQDFEDIVTCLKVDPVEWSEPMQRKVLNAAVASPVSADMIRAAAFAVANGWEGSLSRRASSAPDGPVPAPAPMRVSQDPTLLAPAAGTGSAAASASEQPVEAALAQQAADMQAEYLNTMLSMDMLWTTNHLSPTSQDSASDAASAAALSDSPAL